MPIVNNADLESLELPGIRHKTIAGHLQGVKTMEVWQQTLTPGGASPVHRHACEEVILVLSGHGTCSVGDETLAFGPDSTLILEPNVVHQIINTSDEDMHLVAVLGMAPVRVKTSDGEPMPLPWEAPAP